MHTLCFELILDLVHVPFMMLDANGSIPHTQAQQHHSWALRNKFVIVIVTAIVTAVVIVMLSVNIPLELFIFYVRPWRRQVICSFALERF